MDDYGIDLEEASRVIESAEVLVIRFAILDRRLLIDARTSDQDGPMIAIVPKARSVEERFKSLKKLRPRFQLPDKIMSFMWPRQMETFVNSGLWEKIEARLVSLGGDEMIERCRAIFEDLLGQEKAEVVAAIRGGEGYQALWERPAK
jgi:hypothetical protein